MDSKRNRILELINYIESLGIVVNIGKTKARGNKGIFLVNNECFRIDISKKNSEDNIRTLIHEFSHFVHYKYDKTLKSLDFIFNKLSDQELEELLAISVESVPKNYAARLYNTKQIYKDQIDNYTQIIKNSYPDFKKSKIHKKIEKDFNYPLKYLLKYDCIKYFSKIYNIKNLSTDFDFLTDAQIAYIQLKSYQRKVSKINSKINRLNKYYNQPTELFARFVELYFLNQTKAFKIAPLISHKFKENIETIKIPELSNVNKILQFSN